MMRWLRARRKAREDAEITAAFVSAWMLIAEKRAGRHLVNPPAPTTS